MARRPAWRGGWHALTLSWSQRALIQRALDLAIALRQFSHLHYNQIGSI